MLGHNQMMEIDSVLSPTPFDDPDTSILINDPILISESTPIKVNKKRKIADIADDQQKVETEEESQEKEKRKLMVCVLISFNSLRLQKEFNQFTKSSKRSKF